MWEGIRFSKSGCTSARTEMNGQIHKDLETCDEVSESPGFPCWHLIMPNLSRKSQMLSFLHSAIQRLMPTSPTEITKVHFCQKCQLRTFNLGARSNTERAFKGGNDRKGGKLLEYCLISIKSF